MGFRESPGQLWSKFLFIESCQGRPWSWGDNKPCEHRAFEGVPVGLMLKQKEFKGEEYWKLRFLMRDADETYCFQSGLETNFSKGLLLALQACLPNGTDKPLILSPSLGKDEKIVFCNLWTGGEVPQKVKYEWVKDADCYALVVQLAKQYFPQVPVLPETAEVQDFAPRHLTPASSGVRDWSEIIAAIDLELKRMGWTPEQGRQHLLSTYGKKSRQLLTDDELLGFLDWLQKANEQQLTDDDIPF